MLADMRAGRGGGSLLQAPAGGAPPVAPHQRRVRRLHRQPEGVCMAWSHPDLCSDVGHSCLVSSELDYYCAELSSLSLSVRSGLAGCREA